MQDQCFFLFSISVWFDLHPFVLGYKQSSLSSSELYCFCSFLWPPAFIKVNEKLRSKINASLLAPWLPLLELCVLFHWSLLSPAERWKKTRQRLCRHLKQLPPKYLPSQLEPFQTYACVSAFMCERCTSCVWGQILGRFDAMGWIMEGRRPWGHA